MVTIDTRDTNLKGTGLLVLVSMLRSDQQNHFMHDMRDAVLSKGRSMRRWASPTCTRALKPIAAALWRGAGQTRSALSLDGAGRHRARTDRRQATLGAMNGKRPSTSPIAPWTNCADVA